MRAALDGDESVGVWLGWDGHYEVFVLAGLGCMSVSMVRRELSMSMEYDAWSMAMSEVRCMRLNKCAEE